MPFVFCLRGEKQFLQEGWFSGQWDSCSDREGGILEFLFSAIIQCAPSTSTPALCGTPKRISIFFVRVVTLSSKLPVYVNLHIGEGEVREENSYHSLLTHYTSAIPNGNGTFKLTFPNYLGYLPKLFPLSRALFALSCIALLLIFQVLPQMSLPAPPHTPTQGSFSLPIQNTVTHAPSGLPQHPIPYFYY